MSQHGHPRCRRTKPFILYHWAPVSRRQRIQRQGLVIGRRCVVHSPGWTPTYLCFSDSPSFAWSHSAAVTSLRREWDLWMCWSHHLPGGVFYRKDHVGQQPAELRTFENVPAGKLWRVGSRWHKPRTRKRR